MELKSIEIKFEYQEKIITIKCEEYKTIKEVKEKAIKIIHDIPKDIHCFYLSRDLLPYESITVGDFFNNREKVTLKLMPKKKPIFPIKKRTLERNEDHYFSDIYVNTNVYSSGFNNIGRFQSKKNKLLKSIDTEEIKYINKNKIELKLPRIKNNIKLSIQDDNTFFNDRYNSNKEIKDDDESLRCQNCPNNKFSEYCRNCKEYLCSKCKNEEKHHNHLFIHLNPNYEANIRIFGNILLTDIEHFKEQNNNIINEKEDIINNYTTALKLNQFNEKLNTLINKLKDILNKYESIINQIKDEFILEGENKTNELINKYNEKSTQISNEVNQLFNQLEGHKDKLNLNEFMSYFEKMGKEEEKLNEINKSIIKIHLSSQINEKITSMMNRIEQVMTDTYGDENNLFNLFPNFNIELSDVLKRIKEKEFNENRVRRKKETTKKRKNGYYNDFNEED